jgi:uncharacterized protein (TIGR02687 family)
MTDSIKLKLTERFSAPLSEFYKRRIVFWHDAEKEFGEVVAELVLPNVNIITLTGRNNFAVKRQIAALDPTGNYLVYNPISYPKPDDNWLRDMEIYGEEFRADRTSMRLSDLHIDPSNVKMREAIKRYKRFFENKEREARLQRFGTNYQFESQLHTDIMAALCGICDGGAQVQDIIIAVLSAGLDAAKNTALDNITRFGDAEVFWHLVNKSTGFIYDAEKSLLDLAAHILLTALSQNLIRTAFAGLEKKYSPDNGAFCYQLVHEWQNGNGSGALLDICNRVESELRLVSRLEGLDIDALQKCDTFPCINEIILDRLFASVSERHIRPDALQKIYERRRMTGWYDLTYNYFECLYYASKMLEFEMENSCGFHTVEPNRIWKDYTEKLFFMDSFYRKFHTYFSKAVESPNERLDDALKKVADTIENIYHNRFLKELTESWTKAIAGDLRGFGHVASISRQRNFYGKFVLPTVKQGNRAFVIVSDALRYEVAAELAQKLGYETKGKATLDAVQAIFPSITKFGMAALLPGDKLSVGEKQEIFIDGKPTSDTAKREAVLRAENRNSVATTYADLLKMKKQERRDLVKDMDVVYIYHNAIDAVGDKAATETKVFEACEKAIEEIIGIVKIILGDLSSTNIFITADHGFLYTYSPLEESNKISRQTFTGEVYEIGRRYALVSPEATADYLLYVNLGAAFGDAALKAYTPQDTVRIKVQGGGANYVHGGVSLQETVVPVVVYKGARSDYKKYVEVKNPGLVLINEGRKVTNKIFSLDFLQKEAVSDKVQACTYKVYFVDAAGNAVSDTRIVVADSRQANAAERVTHIKFTLKSIQFSKDGAYRLVIANEVDVPVETGFCIDLAFPDDFGF